MASTLTSFFFFLPFPIDAFGAHPLALTCRDKQSNALLHIIHLKCEISPCKLDIRLKIPVRWPASHERRYTSSRIVRYGPRSFVLSLLDSRIQYVLVDFSHSTSLHTTTTTTTNRSEFMGPKKIAASKAALKKANTMASTAAVSIFDFNGSAVSCSSLGWSRVLEESMGSG